MELGHALAVSGDRTAALAVLADLQALSRHRYVPVAYYAGIYLGLGDKNQTFTWLDRAVSERDDRLILFGGRADGRPDPLRSAAQDVFSRHPASLPAFDVAFRLSVVFLSA
jgi:hypothetical protein